MLSLGSSGEWAWGPPDNPTGLHRAHPAVVVPSGEVSGFGTLPDLFQLGVPRFPHVYFLGLPPRENMML